MLLCLLIISNMATYLFTRFLFSSPPVEVVRERDDSEAALLLEVLSILEEGYFQPLDKRKMIQGAIDGMLKTLDDPYTSYLDFHSLEEMLIHTTGSFSGIGVEITEDEGEVLVLRVIPGTPAERAGLLQGDRIIEVDGKSLTGVSLDEAARLLRGPSGTHVELTIRRAGEGEPLALTIIRADIEMDTVFHSLIEDGIGYIRITNFDQRTGEDFARSLEFLESQGLEGLILDLRNNSGGLLEEAIEVGQIIVPEGEITRMVDRHGQVLERYLSRGEKKDYLIIVLVNGFTASAAEIIAGALQDSGRAFLVGTPTYGKATVQYLKFLSDGGGLRYTIARYLTPKGQDIHRQGLQPNFEIELPEEYYLQYRPIPRNLEPGETGERVILLQKMLKFLGYPLEITGVFHEHTITALAKFQEENNLYPIGELDNTTREKLRSRLADKAREVDYQLLKAVDLIREGECPR